MSHDFPWKIVDSAATQATGLSTQKRVNEDFRNLILGKPKRWQYVNKVALPVLFYSSRKRGWRGADPIHPS